MISLVLPDAARYADWAAAFDEFGPNPKDGTGFQADEQVDTSPAGFEAYLARCERHSDVSQDPPQGLVRCTYFWAVDDGELVGFLALRHALNDFLFDVAGNIGYCVRPSKRRRGYATEALRLGVAYAKTIGVEPVLVTCLATNDASRAVIERCGGQFDDIRHDTRRYWIGDGIRPTGPNV